MHDEQVDVAPDVLRQLLASQFPAWADLDLARVPSSGTDKTIHRLGDELLAAWDDALAAPAWHGPWIPVHGDLSGGNLLLRENRLHAVIDFSCFGLADPANDIDVAWELFEGKHRDTYRAALDVDDDT